MSNFNWQLLLLSFLISEWHPTPCMYVVSTPYGVFDTSIPVRTYEYDMKIKIILREKLRSAIPGTSSRVVRD